jgi:hypothetical protein
LKIFNLSFLIYNFCDLYSNIDFDEFYEWFTNRKNVVIENIYSSWNEEYTLKYIERTYGIESKNLIVLSDLKERQLDSEVKFVRVILINKNKNHIETLIRKFKLKEFS